MSKKDVKRQKLYFMTSPKGFGYHAGRVYDVPEEQAGKFVEQGYARSPKQTLPKDFPHREKLIEAGFESVEAIENADDLTKVKGLGDASVKEIAEYLAG